MPVVVDGVVAMPALLCTATPSGFARILKAVGFVVAGVKARQTKHHRILGGFGPMHKLNARFRM